MPPEPVNGNIYEMSERERKRRKVESLPSSLEEAIAELEKDRFILDVLGSHVSEKYIEAKKLEWAEYKMRVSQWETDHYLMKY